MSFIVKNLKPIIGVLLALLVVWGYFEIRPDHQVGKAFTRFLAAVSDRDWKKAGDLMAPDYRDQWGSDRKTALDLAAQAFRNFLVLEIQPSEVALSREGDLIIISAHLKMTGRGNAIGEAILSEVNGISREFRFAWKRQSWKPWDWKLESIAQPDLTFDPNSIPEP